MVIKRNIDTTTPDNILLGDEDLREVADPHYIYVARIFIEFFTALAYSARVQ